MRVVVAGDKRSVGKLFVLDRKKSKTQYILGLDTCIFLFQMSRVSLVHSGDLEYHAVAVMHQDAAVLWNCCFFQIFRIRIQEK